MEPVKIFMETLNRAWDEKNYKRLALIFLDLRDHLQNVPKPNLATASEIIFDDQTGLLKIVEGILLEKKTLFHQQALKESFHALHIVLELFKEECKLYVNRLRTLCLSCISRRNCNSFPDFYTKQAAAEALKRSIQEFSNDHEQLNIIIEDFKKNKPNKYGENVISCNVLGAIAKHCPRVIAKSADTILLKLFIDLNEHYNILNEYPGNLNIYLVCLFNMLVNFDEFEDHCKDKFCKDYQEWHRLVNNILEKNRHNSKSIIIIDAILQRFYVTIVSYLLSKHAQSIFMDFKSYLSDQCKNNLDKECPRIVCGLGEFSAVYKKYLSPDIFQEELNKIFEVALQAVSFHFKKNEVENLALDTKANCLQSLSKIMIHIPNISLHQIHLVAELTVHFIKIYPKLNVLNRDNALNAFKTAFYNMSQLGNNLQSEYYNSVFNEGIMWSCSHTLVIDVKLQKEIQNLSEDPVSYKNYLSLWISLFTLKKQESCSRATKEVFNEFVTVFVSFIGKLNLNVNSQDDDSDGLFLLKAENNSEMRFFINLVDLYTDCLHEVDNSILMNSIEQLLNHLIKFSYKYPFICNFYKILQVIFKKLNIYPTHSDILSSSTLELISQYISDIIQNVCEVFDGELQLSCVQLILDTPTFLLKDLTDQIEPIFNIAFILGLTNVQLAFDTLKTLENWFKSSNFQCSSTFINNIIHCTEPYFSNREVSLEIITSKVKPSSDPSVFTPSHNNFHQLQKEILLFYGSLDANLLLDYIYEKSNLTEASWGSKYPISYELLFPDTRLGINFDKFITRTIELTTSQHRRTKVSACELFHAFITIILGKKSLDQCLNRSLLNAILRLSRDSNESIKNVFYILFMQLTHYLASRGMSSNVVINFVDFLFETLTEISNPSEISSGVYLREFTESCIRQTTGKTEDLPVVKRIIQNIIDYALCQSNRKRLTAVLAFNHLHRIFRKNSSIIDKHWLEFMYVFAKSTEECIDIQVINALDNVEEVMKLNQELLKTESIYRQKPPEFSDGTFNSAVIWLFNYCGSKNTKCRWKCMDLFEKLVLNSEHVENRLVDEVAIIVKKNLGLNIETIPISNVLAFLITLEFYIWIFKSNFLSFESITKLIDSLNETTFFFNQFNKFVSIIAHLPDRGRTSLRIEECLKNVKDNKELISLINQITLKTLEFVSLILSKENFKIENVWTDDLNLFISHCVLRPYTIGLTGKHFHLNEKLPIQLQILITAIVKHFDARKFLNDFRENLLLEIVEDVFNFTDIQIIMGSDIYQIKKFTYYLKGLLILVKCKFINFENEYSFTITYVLEKLRGIFGSLKIELMNGNRLSRHVKKYFEELMRFFFENHQLGVLEELVTLVLNDDQLSTEPNGQSVLHGEFFFKKFKIAILECMLRNPTETMKVFDKYLMEFPEQLLLLTKELMIFAKHKKIREANILADEMIRNFKSFQELNGLENKNSKLSDIFGLAVNIKMSSTEALSTNRLPADLYSWILGQLSQSNNLEKKSIVLTHFSSCLADEESTESTNSELLSIFQNLRNEDSRTYVQELESDKLRRMQTGSFFQALLKMLSITKSLIVYKALIKFSAGIFKYLPHGIERSNLKIYFNTISDANALKSLQVAYEMFSNTNLTNDRLEILNHFLLPSIQLSKSLVAKKFYQEINKWIISIISTVEFHATTNLITLKIGCYNMLELFFAKYIDDETFDYNVAIHGVLQQITIERTFIIRNTDAKELTRILHCAALNCCISIVSFIDDEKLYEILFKEDKEKGQLIWERIIDCNEVYDFALDSSNIRECRKKLINIREVRNKIPSQDPIENSSTYFHHYDLRSLTFLEDIHLYDLNDVTVKAEALTCEDDNRLILSFEHDQLNEHECMPMICGFFAHIRGHIARLQDGKRQITTEELPEYLGHLRDSFRTKHNNVRLYLMKIICNTKNVFMPLIGAFFLPIAGAICGYLADKPLNYILRDILVILIESKLEVLDESEAEAAQQLIEQLVQKARDDNVAVCKYNVELVESLCYQWRGHLKISENLQNIDKDMEPVTLDPFIRVIMTLLSSDVTKHTRSVDQKKINHVVQSQIELHLTGDESVLLLRFGALGLLLKIADENSWRGRLSETLHLLSKVERLDRDRCARCAYAVYKSCRCETRCSEIFKFTRLDRVSESQKPECLDLFCLRVPQLLVNKSNLLGEIRDLDLGSILRHRTPGCEEPALKIVLQAMADFDDVTLKTYVELAISYTKPDINILPFRKLAYKILVKAYPLSKELYFRVLFTALDDPAEEVKKIVIDFWNDKKVGLAKTFSERLLQIMDMYTSDVQAQFPRFVCLLMLELTKNSHDANQLIFKQPLADTSLYPFRDVDMVQIRKRNNYAVIGSLFASSLASQLERAAKASFSQQSSFPSTRRFLATRNSLCEHAQDSQEFNTIHGSNSQFRKSQNPSENKLSKRIFMSPSEMLLTDSYKDLVQTPNQYYKKIKQEMDDSKNRTTFCRKYRLGEYPDIDITHSSFVECLIRLISRDCISCKELIMCFFKHFENTHLKDKLATSFTKILDDLGDKNSFAPILLENVILKNIVDLDTESVTKTCKSIKTDPLSILLIEKNLVKENMRTMNCDEPPTKKIKSESQKKVWVELASLYKSISEYDVVNSIFNREELFSEDLRDGARALADNDWRTAKNIYERAYNSGTDLEKNFCETAMFECLRHLSSWNEINEKINSIVNENHDLVLENPREELLPWVFESKLHEFLEDIFGVQRKTCFGNHKNIVQIDEILINNECNEEVVMFHLCDVEKTNNSSISLNSCMSDARKEWIYSTPTNKKKRSKIILKLRDIYNMEAYIKTLSSLELKVATKNLIDYWNRQLPSMEGDPLNWYKLVNYRLTFGHLLHKRVQAHVKGSSREPLLNDLISAGIKHRLKVSEIALENENIVVAEKHILVMKETLKKLDKNDHKNLHYDFNLILSKYKFVQGVLESNADTKSEYFMESWKIGEVALNNEKISLQTKINILHHMFDLTLKLKYYTNQLSQSMLEIIEKFLKPSKYSDILEKACDTGVDNLLAESYVKLGKYCYNLLHDTNQQNSILFKEFISAILTAMYLGSLEAVTYFPCIFRFEFDGNEAAQLFIEKTKRIPSWLFLTWQAQIMSNLSKLPLLTVPIVKRLANDYPNGIIYSFRQACHDYPQLKANSGIREIHQLYFIELRIDEFLYEIQRVCQPENYLRHSIFELLNSKNEITFENIETLIEKVFRVNADGKFQPSSAVYTDIEIYLEKLEDLKNMEEIEIRRKLSKMSESLLQDVENKFRKRQDFKLKHFSPYLNDFRGDKFEIEVPGQYVEKKKPILKYHAKILRFDTKIAIISSLCYPIKVNVIATDARRYSFLVKLEGTGQDLRQDERLQQIFRVANDILDADGDCKQRRLSLNTYKVVPLSTSLGLIQWIDNTKSFQELLQFSNAISEVSEKYQIWITKAGKSKQRMSQYYQQALVKYKSSYVISKMREFEKQIGDDLLAKTFIEISPSLDAFLILRRNFITSYATMCIVNWITGVGDRNLGNLLIEIPTGMCYGIDFVGYAFGGGFDASVPELVPFRLTAQILSFLKPFDENGLFGMTMIRVLKTMMKDKQLFLGCLDTILHEPLVWIRRYDAELLGGTSSASRPLSSTHSSSQWPKLKFSFARRKLNGGKPSSIMCEEIAHSSSGINEEYLEKYKLIINGNDNEQKSVRSVMKNESLSPEEQIQCLLEQAKDLNALGRMWKGWRPFV